MEGRQKRKANILSAAQYEAALGGSAGSGSSAGSAYMDSDTRPSRVNGEIVNRHLIVFHTNEDKLIHMTVEITVSIGAIYAQIKQYLGFDVTLHQTIKNKTYKLDPNEIAEDGMHFGYSVDVKPVVSVPVERTKDGRRILHEMPGILRAASPPADEKDKQAKTTKSAKTAKDDKAAAPPADKGGSGYAAGYHIKQDPLPAGVPRSVPGGWMLAQAPRKPDADGNLPEIEYTKVFVHQGMP